MQKVYEIVSESAKAETCVLVVSAMQGVTDALIEVGKLASQGDETFRDKIKLIESKHFTAVRELISTNFQSNVLSQVKLRLNELENLCEGIYLLRELSARTLDRVVSFGELLSSIIISAKFTSENVANVWQDTRKIIKTDSNFGNATVDFPKTDSLIKQFISENPFPLFVFGGFISSDANDVTTTLGRGGSDYTAAIFASALDANVLEIWTDVSGMMTANPKLVRNAKAVKKISYKEAMELSHFGAKVIYPPTIQPVMSKKIPVLIKNTFASEDEGTLIEAETKHEEGIATGITSIDSISLLTLEGSGMIGVTGFSKRLFESLSNAKVNVILITQSSSEHSICVGIAEKDAKLAEDAINEAFSNEIDKGKVESVKVEKSLSILALVGDKMREHQGISGKMFSALGHNGVNVRAIAQGSSERNISAVIETKDVKKAVNVIHEAFFESSIKQVNVFIAGVGNVGKKLLTQLSQQEKFLEEKLRLNLKVVGLANSKGVFFKEDGFLEAKSAKDDLSVEAEDLSAIHKNQSVLTEDLSVAKENLSASTGNLSVADLNANSPYLTSKSIDHLIISENLRNSVFVDMTSSEQIALIYEDLLKKSVSVVACNKISASSSYKNYAYLKDLAREYSTSFLFETNVGAGLPIINSLNDLISSGDVINEIQAVLSGTLNFVFNNYDGSRRFAEVVQQAQDEGYTEPDPRLDLSGTDVARKILILIREAGNKIEFDEIENVSFLPAECFDGTVADFYKALERNEAHFKALLEEAKAKGEKLKYIASYKDGNAKVSLQSVKAEHDFYSLSGKDNAVLFYTNRYVAQPLVVKGAGAGAEVTASGVFADIIRASKI
jgi:aspartokinase/homoserine dehydrogenase 1